MIRLILTALLLFSYGCRSDNPETTDSESPAKEETRARNRERAKLLNEKQDLLNQLDRLIKKTKLDPDGRIAILETSTRDAQGRFLEVRKTHPLLVKVNADIKHWQNTAHSASAAGKTDEASLAKTQLIKARGDLNKMSQSLPELAQLQKIMEENKVKILELRQSIASQTPEGQKIVARIKEIEETIKDGPAPAP